MWITLLTGIMKRPWIIALVVMTIFMGGQWIKITSLKGDIVDLEAKVVRIESNYVTCTTNEKTLKDKLEVNLTNEKRLNIIITGLQEQVTAEQQTAAEWERKYKNRPIITKVKEVPVIQYVEKGVVVDEETSKEYVKYFNTLFAD